MISQGLLSPRRPPLWARLLFWVPWLGKYLQRRYARSPIERWLVGKKKKMDTPEFYCWAGELDEDALLRYKATDSEGKPCSKP